MEIQQQTKWLVCIKQEAGVQRTGVGPQYSTTEGQQQIKKFSNKQYGCFQRAGSQGLGTLGQTGVFLHKMTAKDEDLFICSGRFYDIPSEKR